MPSKHTKYMGGTPLPPNLVEELLKLNDLFDMDETPPPSRSPSRSPSKSPSRSSSRSPPKTRKRKKTRSEYVLPGYPKTRSQSTRRRKK